MVKKDCCKTNNKDAAKKGLLFGLLAHTPCIFIIIITILGISLGSTVLSTFLSAYLFYGLIALSGVLTIVAAIIYLKRNDALSAEGIRSNWKYLSILFGIVIIINILFLTVVFPLAASAAFTNNTANLADTNTNSNISQITLNVSIPCSGHVFIINSALTKDPGVINVDFQAPRNFVISYDKTKTTKENILNNPIFKDFPAKEV